MLFLYTSSIPSYISRGKYRELARRKKAPAEDNPNPSFHTSSFGHSPMAEKQSVHDEGEEVEESNAADGCISTPRSPIILRKRQLSSISSHSSKPATPYKKKTRELPNISNCHCCGARCPDNGRDEGLKVLDSQWRIVLLCRSCLGRIRSAKVCSYCFVEFSGGEAVGEFISCRQCSCRVHLSCLPNQRSYVLSLDLDPLLFTCVDCCAMPKCFSVKNNVTVKGSCPVAVSRVYLEEVVRDANSTVEKKTAIASRAKEKALEKAIAAKHAAELARHALDAAISMPRKPSLSVKPMVADEELALQLHLSMNGSQRILRSQSSLNHLFVQKGEEPNDSVCMDPMSGNKTVNTICREFQVCKENRSCETFDIVDGESVFPIDGLEYSSNASSESWKESLDEGDKQTKNSEEIYAKEEQASCSEKIESSAANDNFVDSTSASCHMSNVQSNDPEPNKHSGAGEIPDSAIHLKECNAPGRYLKKYYSKKKNQRLKKSVYDKESVDSAPVLIRCLQMNCSNASRTLSNA